MHTCSVFTDESTDDCCGLSSVLCGRVRKTWTGQQGVGTQIHAAKQEVLYQNINVLIFCFFPKFSYPLVQLLVQKVIIRSAIGIGCYLLQCSGLLEYR